MNSSFTDLGIAHDTPQSPTMRPQPVETQSGSRARVFSGPTAEVERAADDGNENYGGGQTRSESALRILVVEDDDDVRNLLAAILRRSGYDVACAADGEAGWTALNAGNFDLLITDHEMPRLCGLELLQRVRAAALGLPVIMISGNLPITEREFSDAFSPAAAMHKPFMASQILAEVRSFSDAATAA